MTVVNKNAGHYISYALSGTKLTISSGALAIELTDYEQDYSVHLDISETADGKLVLGTSYLYVAELDIQPRVYEIIKGEADDFGFHKLYKKAVPLDTGKVTLTLWALEVPNEKF